MKFLNGESAKLNVAASRPVGLVPIELFVLFAGMVLLGLKPADSRRRENYQINHWLDNTVVGFSLIRTPSEIRTRIVARYFDTSLQALPR